MHFRKNHTLVKLGYEEFSRQLLEEAWIALRRNELNEDHRLYLIECLKRTLEIVDANKGFYLKNGKGKKRKPTGLRDLHAAALVMYHHKNGLILEDAFEEANKSLASMFREAPIGVEAVEAAYNKHSKKIKRDWDKIEPVLREALD